MTIHVLQTLPLPWQLLIQTCICTSYPLWLGGPRQCGIQSLPNTSTHDQNWEWNPRPSDLEYVNLTTCYMPLGRTDLGWADLIDGIRSKHPQTKTSQVICQNVPFLVNQNVPSIFPLYLIKLEITNIFVNTLVKISQSQIVPSQNVPSQNVPESKRPKSKRPKVKTSQSQNVRQVIDHAMTGNFELLY